MKLPVPPHNLNKTDGHAVLFDETTVFKGLYFTFFYQTSPFNMNTSVVDFQNILQCEIVPGVICGKKN
jgi:hypothetical protein